MRMGLTQYYKYYLTLHTHPKCRLLHFIGQWVTILFTIFIVYTKYWILLPLILFIIYPFAWSGHYFFEKNEPAAFNNPIKAKISDWIMFFEILTGKLKI